MSDTEEEDYIVKSIKITLVGEPSTGKTSTCRRFVGAGVSGGGGGTQGAEVTAAQFPGVTSPLRLCDVSGAALHTGMLPNYLYDTDILIFVYDLTNLQSFEMLKSWMDKVKEIVETEKKKPLLTLFGNKSDLEHQRAVRLSCVQKFASEYFLDNYKGSARTGEMINTMFSNLLSKLLGIRLPEVAPYKKTLHTQISETTSNVPLMIAETASTLIVDRKMLRKLQRKSSSVCSIQ